jgi:hypothetical protein
LLLFFLLDERVVGKRDNLEDVTEDSQFLLVAFQGVIIFATISQFLVKTNPVNSFNYLFIGEYLFRL